MPAERAIRAVFDATTITVYQAFRPEIAAPAVSAQRFVPPFALTRMTWIKPSFLWMMERSGWAAKPGQERVLAIRITRAGWEAALSQAVQTSFDPRAHRDHDDWRAQLAAAPVRAQWDPERDVVGAKLPYRSLQLGLGPPIVPRYVNEWTVAIADITPTVRTLHDLIRAGHLEQAMELLPGERVYPVSETIARRLGMAAA